VGFMLIYFSPAFYCDVSDSYMFPNRTNRMAVAMAGGFAQLTVWGICTIIWRLTETDAFINKLALIVIVFSGLQTLLNFNPLIKLDGYYMLTDFLEIPNLRAKALRSFWDWIAGNGKSRWSYREKRAQLIYGAASAVFSMSLLVYVYSRLYTWATSKYALAGLVVFGIFANFTLRKALVEPMEGVKAAAARASKKRYRNIAIALILLILSVVLHWELKVSAAFKIIPSDEFTVRPETEGIVVEIRAHEGSVVHKGDVLARIVLTDFDEQEKHVDTLGQLQRVQRELEDLQRGTRPEAIAEHEQSIARIKVEKENVNKIDEQRGQYRESLKGKNADLNQKRQDLKLHQDLLKDGLYAPADVVKDESAVKVAESAVSEIEAQIRALDEKAANDDKRLSAVLAEAESHLTVMKAGSRLGEIQQKEAEVVRLTKDLEYLTRRLKKTDIVAGINGVVATEFVERQLGTHLNPGEELMKLVDTSTVLADMMVPEKELEDVNYGNYVRMFLRSFSTRDFDGHVVYMAPYAQTVNGEQVITVRAELANKDGILKPEMTGVAKIYCGKRRIIDLMTLRIRRWLKTEFRGLLP